MSKRELTGLEALGKISGHSYENFGFCVIDRNVEPYKDIIRKELFRYCLYQNGIWTQLDGDKTLTHYNVLDQTQDKLLICYGSISWKTGETDFDPHIINFNDYMNSWWLKEDQSE